MNATILICFVVSTVAFIVLVVFAVRTLMQVYRTAKQAEILLSSINQEVSAVGRITASIGNFFSSSFPVIKIGTIVSGMVAGWFAKRKKAE